MERRWGQIVVRVVLNGAALATAALAGWALRKSVPPVLHSLVFAGAALLNTFLIGLAWQVLNKADKALNETRDSEIARTETAYAYIKKMRNRLFATLWAAVLAALASGIAAGAIKEHAFPDDGPVIVAGYTAISVLVLVAIRVTSAYLSFDDFNQELKSAIAREGKRLESLKSLRPSELLPDVATAPAMQVHPPRKAI